jgi:hypothetical protein
VEVYFGLELITRLKKKRVIQLIVYVLKSLWPKSHPPLVCLPENRVGAREMRHKERERCRELEERRPS